METLAQLTSTEATAAMTAAFRDRLMAIELNQPAATVDYPQLLNAAGRCLGHITRMVWSDVWASYDAMHAAMGLPMIWRGGAETGQPKLAESVGYVLRAVNTSSALMAIAEADRHFRRARLTCLRETEDQIDLLIKHIDSRRDDQTTSGRLDQSARVARLVALRALVASEKIALGLAPCVHFIVIEGRHVRVTIGGDDCGDTIDVSALCPECGDDTAWTIERRGYCGEQAFAVDENCGKEWPVKFGVIEGGR